MNEDHLARAKAGDGIVGCSLDQELVEEDPERPRAHRHHVGMNLQGDSGGAELILGGKVRRAPSAGRERERSDLTRRAVGGKMERS